MVEAKRELNFVPERLPSLQLGDVLRRSRPRVELLDGQIELDKLLRQVLPLVHGPGCARRDNDRTKVPSSE